MPKQFISKIKTLSSLEFNVTQNQDTEAPFNLNSQPIWAA